MQLSKVKLSFWQIWNMNVGFFGIQFSFGLQQTAINPIFSFLGAHHADLPILNLAGPVTGLLIQPLIGAISDKTWLPKYGGRRKPFFLIGAILGSLCLFAFPFSPSLWFAVGLLWILDAANNTAMEPYRAFVGDKVSDEQLTFGYQMQSLFVGAGITIANFSLFLFQDWFGGNGDSVICAAMTDSGTAIPKWVYYSFFLGAIASIGTVMWSNFKTPEIPPSDEELKEIKEYNKGKPAGIIQIFSALIIMLAIPVACWLLLASYTDLFETRYFIGLTSIIIITACWFIFLYHFLQNGTGAFVDNIRDLLAPFMETLNAISGMPNLLKKLSGVFFFQWYALFVYWQFITPMLRQSVYGISNEDLTKLGEIKEACATGVRVSSSDIAFAETIQNLSEQALAQTGLMNGTYNLVTMIVALILVPFAARFGSRLVYAVSLAFTGLAMLSMPYIEDEYLLLIPMILFGIGWASMMGIPYSLVSKVIPQDRRGVYMGIVNMMIVIPMLIQTVSFGSIIQFVLADSAVNAIIFGGVFFLIAAILALRLK